MAATVGKLWKSHRKIMPLSIQEGVLDLLFLLREVILPHEGKSLASNVQEARADVRTLLQLCGQVARREPKTLLLPPPPPPPHYTPPQYDFVQLPPLGDYSSDFTAGLANQPLLTEYANVIATGPSTSSGNNFVKCIGCDTHIVSSNDATRVAPICGWCSGPKCTLDFKYEDFCFALSEDDIGSGMCNDFEPQANVCTAEISCQTTNTSNTSLQSNAFDTGPNPRIYFDLHWELDVNLQCSGNEDRQKPPDGGAIPYDCNQQ